MDGTQVRAVLDAVREGKLSTEEAVERLKLLPYEELGFATLDSHRSLRQGFPEVLFCPGKTIEQIAEIAARLLRQHSTLLATRATEEMYSAIAAIERAAEYNPNARTVVVRRDQHARTTGTVLVMSAGTADISVAEEAAVTADFLGSRVEKLYDVGVAGLHRVLNKWSELQAARVLVVAAGMDGVLPSVVGGLTARPLIAVPTSVGYGASFGGLAALLTMLNSCAAGTAVVNIDNGFGAGVLAHRINLLGEHG
ncbi:MAG: nickel pincer cofactor biosynthesis protein LarB [Candidatus Methylomirabilales bacterium]